MGRINKIIGLFLFVNLMTMASLIAQSVCNNLPAGAVKGDFEIVGGITSGCSPFTVNVADKSGGTDIRYEFYYGGTAPSGLNRTGNTATTNVYFSNNNTNVYTILQYGKKNGADMYECKTITVRPNNKPVFSYNTCNNNSVEINIPKAIENDFDYYFVDWGDGAANPERVNKNQLPFSKTRSLTLPRTIQVEGFFNSANLNCSSPQSVVIPFKIPTAFPLGYEDPHFPNIKKMELKNASTAELTFTGAFNPSGYELYRKPSNGNYAEIQNKLQPGTLVLSIPDSTKSYCFFLGRNIACGYEVSAEMCTLPLFEVLPIELENSIKWSNYPNNITAIDNRNFGRYLDKSQKVIVKEGSAVSSLDLNNLATQFVHTPSDCKNKVCYRIELETSGQIYYHKFGGTSISNEICVDRKAFKPPPITDTWVSVEGDNKIEINFTDNSSWNLRKDKFLLFRNSNTGFIKIDSIIVSGNFTDTNVKTEENSYEYKIAYEDQCGSLSEFSNNINTLLLGISSNEDLNWNFASTFGLDNILNFEIIAFDENTNSEISVGTLSPQNLQFIPNFDDFETEAKFKIKAIGQTGKISQSNIVKIPIEALFFIPTAFSPNGDGINDELIIKGRFGRVTEYNFQVYDRWGGLVFFSKDKNLVWDGMINNKLGFGGNYQYKFFALLNDGQKINLSGNIYLIK